MSRGFPPDVLMSPFLDPNIIFHQPRQYWNGRKTAINRSRVAANLVRRRRNPAPAPTTSIVNGNIGEKLLHNKFVAGGQKIRALVNNAFCHKSGPAKYCGPWVRDCFALTTSIAEHKRPENTTLYYRNSIYLTILRQKGDHYAYPAKKNMRWTAIKSGSVIHLVHVLVDRQLAPRDADAAWIQLVIGAIDFTICFSLLFSSSYILLRFSILLFFLYISLCYAHTLLCNLLSILSWYVMGVSCVSRVTFCIVVHPGLLITSR